MSGMGGILTGTLVLAATEALLTTAHGNRLGELFAVPGAAVRWFISPATPLIPDRRSATVKGLQQALATAYSMAANGAATTPGTGAENLTPGGGAGGGTPAPKTSPGNGLSNPRIV